MQVLAGAKEQVGSRLAPRDLVSAHHDVEPLKQADV